MRKFTSISSLLHYVVPTIATAFVASRRPICQTLQRRQAWAAQALRPWMCIKEECHHVNRAKEPACEACGQQKPVLMGWVCSGCSTSNHKGVKFCRKCAAKPPAGVWSCAACHKNNAVDDIDDNSRCGHCGYDMAPLSKSEEEIIRIRLEREASIRQDQERFDSISRVEADDQMGSETAGHDPKQPAPWASPSTLTSSSAETSGVQPPTAAPLPGASTKRIVLESISPFKPMPQPRASSILSRKPKSSAAVLMPKPTGPPGFDWMCRDSACGMVNGGDDEACSSCHTRLQPVEWECLCCAGMNHWSRRACFNCKIPIPVSWACQTCKAMTSVYDKVCRNCKAPRPVVEPKTVKDATQMVNQTALPFKPRRSDWSCPSCHILNFGSRTSCFKCSAEKPGATSPVGGDGNEWNAEQKANVGDANWQCAHCGASNFRTRSTCWQCDKAPTSSQMRGWEEDTLAPQFEKEGFQAGVEDTPAPGQLKTWGSKGPEDWTCSKCFSANFKGKSQCFKCGAAKATVVAPRKAFTKKSVKI